MVNSKVVATTDVLMARIVSGEYVGFLPAQDALARDLNVSRTSIREAISKLEVWNVVCVKPKIGSRINPASAWALVNVPFIMTRLKMQGLTLDEVVVDALVAEIRATLTKAITVQAEEVTTSGI
jgi:DNA-binding FadR family transcriptional regulator